MSYQLPPLLDEDAFEKLIRDLLRRVYDDPGIERYGRKGQAQSGVDGLSPADSTIRFQCKLKDTRHEPDARIRAVLLNEMEEELLKTTSLPKPLTRFIFASTFKNDTELQNKAALLSSDTLTVEYWGWETITERMWEYAEELIPIYYPHIPIKSVHGFRRLSGHAIEKSRLTNKDRLKELALDYYRINDRTDIVLRVVINDLDIRNTQVMDEVYRRLENLSRNATLWLIGDGGSGKTTILHRLAMELALRGENVFTLNLEAQFAKSDVESILSQIKFCSPSEQTVLCIDNPAANEEALETILREIPDYADNVHVILAERAHRYYALQRTGVLTYLHGQEENEPVRVRNSRRHREEVYNKLFDLLGVHDADLERLMTIVRNERLVYVNATYSILLELRKQRKINFDFDWDDYRKTVEDLMSFTEGYRYIALFYLFGVRTYFETFSRVCGADSAQQKVFLERFRGLVNEPIIVDEWRDESSKKITHLRTKHEIVSEIFFQEHPLIDRDEILMQWCEQTDFSDPEETQSLINIFGLKKNYLAESDHVNFEKLIDFLLTGYLKERVARSPKLVGTLNLAKFWLLSLRERFDEAIKALEEFIETEPEDAHSRTELAKVYQRQGRFADAQRVLLQILEYRPNDLNSRTELAKIYQRQGKLNESESVLLALLQIDENNIQGLTEIAKVYRAQHRFEEAETLLLEILGRKPRDLNSRTELAKVYQRQGKLVEAEAVLMELLKLEPNDLQARTELAKIYQRQGILVEAEAVLMELLKLEPNNLQARTELAKIYQRQGILVEAEAVLMELLKLEPNNLQARTELAKIYQRQGKLAEAETLLLQSLEIDAQQLHPRTELAKIYQRQGKLDEAVQRLLEYIRLDPKGLHPRTELAKIYQRQGKLAEAETLLLQSLEIDAQQLHPRTELAKIYQRQGKLDEAETLLLQSLEIDAQQLHPRTELAKIYQRQGKLAEAEAVLMELLTLEANDLQARTELAKIYQRQGKLDEAVTIAEELLALDPLNEFALSELLGTWLRQGEKEKCKTRFFTFIEQPKYKFSRYSQAPFFRFFQCCRKFGMKDEAKRAYERFQTQLDDRNIHLYQSTFFD